MRAKHEKKIVKETDAFERGQSSPAPDHEKGSSDQEFQTISEVGHTGNDRKGDASVLAAMPSTPARSFWFDDATKEIGARPGSWGTVAGWVYVRTKTGHLRKRAGGRGRVS